MWLARARINDPSKSGSVTIEARRVWLLVIGCLRAEGYPLPVSFQLVRQTARENSLNTLMQYTKTLYIKHS